MIEAVFFDFGGVVGRLDRGSIRDLENEYGLAEGDLLTSIYGIPEWREAETGRVSEDVWVEAANRALDEKAGRPVPELHERWRTIWREIDRDVVDLIGRLRGRYRVGMISNSTTRLESQLLEPFGLLDLFEVVVNSARVGMAKPDTRIYHHAARQLDVEPQACVHIDDLPPNVQGAIDAGFAAVHHKGDFGELAGALRSLGVDW